MKHTFELVLSELLSIEGGFSNRSRKADPGGPTNYGITQGTLSAWRGQPVSVQEVKQMNESEAIEIYRAQYWDAVKGDKLPLGLDYAMFDFTVNSGPSRAVKTLQTILGVGVDGVLGFETLAAIHTRSDILLIGALSEERLKFMKKLRNWSYNKNGWSKRVKTVKQRSLELALHKSPELKPPTMTAKDAVIEDVGAKARGEDTSALSAFLTPEGITKASIAASGFSGILAGSGPLQWGFAFALIAAVCIGGYLMIQKARVA
ncbi:glycoside hydrolase family 108 protein [Pseudovibrio sp. Tun.PSC04-5.I4]|uniref:glycoside hydrolase family 108 protein n=1 Tax=Pseudovibrio sp. Tun.PSC04-5.I4 TaxID=1798213 RepID=UPI00088DF266|nr:glycoside hydrolase family 108 protein [Pseudovibrio sp. Tun.PSC04-5.I4]SDR19764.1 Lysozyme family protein [Pseudovibrio sp. Tun.PSC04-5.I4]